MAHEKILVVDDSSEIIYFLKQYVLVPFGYEVLTAKDGQQGLDISINDHPDLILLDMSMPQMNGLQMLRQLRQTKSNVPVIFMTMHGSEYIASEAIRLGVKDYLIKPFTVEEVTVAIDRALQEVRLMREKEELQKELIEATTVRQTVITLAHYLNNDLTVVKAGLSLIQESMSKKDINFELTEKIIRDSQASIRQIAAVMRVLQKITHVTDSKYFGPVKIFDI
jgi:DNA-binding response OmpR family regulator